MECFFINLDILIWIIVFLVLNMKLVSDLYNFVFLIFVGLRNRNELIGWLGFVSLVCECCIVLDIVVMVFCWLIICLCSIFFMCSNLLCLFLSIFVIGILVYCDNILVILVFEILFFSNRVFCVLFLVVFFSFIFNLGIWLYCSFDIWFKLEVWWVIFKFSLVCFNLDLMDCVFCMVFFLFF